MSYRGGLLTVKVGFTIDVDEDDSEAEEEASSSARTTAAARSAVAIATRIAVRVAYCLARSRGLVEVEPEAENAQRRWGKEGQLCQEGFKYGRATTKLHAGHFEGGVGKRDQPGL